MTQRIRLTPTRFGWSSEVVDNLSTTTPPWWRPTRRGARRVALRYLRRQQARRTREEQSILEDWDAPSARRREPQSDETPSGVPECGSGDSVALETRSGGWGDYPLSETYPGSGIYE